MPMTRTLNVAPNGGIPNNPDLPAIIVTNALEEPTAETAQALCMSHGWGGTWVWSVYDFHHYHPSSHEALICVAGKARLHLGGPEGEEVEIEAGDALILPAGFGHKRLSSSDDFAVVGAYPTGQESPEIVRADDLDMKRAADLISATPLPESDPLEGSDGPLLGLWRP